MHRLFVAVRPPREIRERLLGIMGGVQNARWQTDEQLHLTLRFIGEVDRHRAEEVAAALGSVRQKPFEVALAGVGAFGRHGKGAIWAGVAPHDELKRLHKRLDQSLARVGVEPESRAYHPHITLARLPRNAGPAQPFIQRWAGLSSPPFVVDAICLYESKLGAEGASYSVIEEYRLA